jgi:UDP-glucose 4-epimerase
LAKCLVTGSRGGIGSHLCERLKADGHEVYGLDLKSGAHHDIRLSYNVEIAFQGFKPDWVFHLAALADIVPSIEDPANYHRTNVDGTVNVLEASRKHGVQRFIYAASSSCYGKFPFTPTSELEPADPQYPYALTKWIGEQYVLHYSKVYGLGAVSLRLFNVYGPGFRTNGAYGAVLGVFLAQLANNAPLTLVGDGHQMRDFTYVTDVCDAMVRAASSKFSGAVFNVGSGRPQRITKLIELLGSPPTVSLPDRPGEPRITHADTSRISDLLHWFPQINFKEGVAIMLKHLDSYKDAPVWTPEKIQEATKVWFEKLGDASCER